jgi:hypothetical protein
MGAGSGTVLGINGGAAVQRVRALSQPTPAPMLRRLAAPILLGAAIVALAGAATEAFVDLAHAWL